MKGRDIFWVFVIAVLAVVVAALSLIYLRSKEPQSVANRFMNAASDPLVLKDALEIGADINPFLVKASHEFRNLSVVAALRLCRFWSNETPNNLPANLWIELANRKDSESVALGYFGLLLTEGSNESIEQHLRERAQLLSNKKNLNGKETKEALYTLFALQIVGGDGATGDASEMLKSLGRGMVREDDIRQLRNRRR